MTTSDYNDTAVKDICYNCGSPVAKQSYNYFRRLDYVTGGKGWSKVWSKGDTPVAFYYANRCRDHVRLIGRLQLALRQHKSFHFAYLCLSQYRFCVFRSSAPRGCDTCGKISFRCRHYSTSAQKVKQKMHKKCLFF